MKNRFQNVKLIALGEGIMNDSLENPPWANSLEGWQIGTKKTVLSDGYIHLWLCFYGFIHIEKTLNWHFKYEKFIVTQLYFNQCFNILKK